MLTFFGQAESASRIMASRDPAEAKRISYDVSGPRDLQNKWDAQSVDFMKSLVRAKCDQNPLVLRELQSTGTKIIAESGKDRFYGTGLSITHSDILNGTKWAGISTLREILMNIRREKNQDTYIYLIFSITTEDYRLSIIPLSTLIPIYSYYNYVENILA